MYGFLKEGLQPLHSHLQTIMRVVSENFLLILKLIHGSELNSFSF